ncbi:outer membrane receptor protein involved in Fe transport [Lewinella marina]|uniref:TonB-dependent receptor n=1 Tax=Neolewinella marina TaxID=438751 RepID=A0A2G0CHC0_9BACT|nr:TonB-dependent receptor [Neolewinella marina]NJB86150.1 outer membrane receptor protein involved in Fe transport [Neolewinella marina]PHK99372.1 TonB-dependent receptor [Neolewinella marina]
MHHFTLSAALTLLLVLLHGTCVRAQTTVTGRVVDASGGQPIEFATVMVADAATGTSRGGTTTDPTGNFSVTAPQGDFYVEVSFIGFQTARIDDIEVAGGEASLGVVELVSQGQTLDEVTVRAEKSQTVFKLDKRVFNVGQDLSSTGASALEVLSNVPSVTVTMEGAVQLRGSGGVQILVDGKPSVIASEQGNLLGTLTADMIESVEVITNPSAKYDAEGTSGIINIVLKKEEKKGLNGAVSVNTGVPDNHSVGLSLNRRTEKFNLFSQLGVGYRSLPEDITTVNRDLSDNTSLYSTGEEFRNETFYNVVLGTDYHINERNVLTLSGNFAYEVEDQPSFTEFRLEDAAGETASRWNREETTEATNPKYQFEFQYKRDFEDHKDHDLLFSAIGTLFSKDQASEFVNTTLSGDDRSGRQRTRTDFGEQTNTFKLDYTRPFTEKLTVETGTQYVTDDVQNDYSVSNYLNEVFVEDPSLTNVFNWRQNVMAAYATAGYDLGDWGVKVGLRLENTDLETVLETTDETNTQNYTNLFPSAHTSYQLTEAISFQGGYSRRVFRPRMWDLNPFFNLRNNFTIRTGNPNLQPEYTDSYELTSIYILEQASLNFGVYHRYTTDVVERVTTFQDNVSISKPINVGTNRATGVEFNAKYEPFEFVTLTGDVNYNYFKREGELEDVSFDFSADQLNGRVSGKFDLPLDIDFEVTGNYQSAYQTVQSEVSSFVFMDLGLRKRLFEGRGAINFSVRDLFASRIEERVLEQPTFYQYSRELRGTFVTLGFSYGFGKGETMEYLGQRRRF